MPKEKALFRAFSSKLVPKAGLEPARVLTPAGFSYYYSFHYHIHVCSLDFLFTISYDLGIARQVSTPYLLLQILARDCHQRYL